jgi:hypothetical protein
MLLTEPYQAWPGERHLIEDPEIHQLYKTLEVSSRHLPEHDADIIKRSGDDGE